MKVKVFYLMLFVLVLIVAFDGSSSIAQPPEWIVYNTDNCGLPINMLVPALACDAQDNLWIGTRGKGLAKFDGENWTVYNTDNSGLPHNQVVALAFDAQGNIWIGTGVFWGYGGGGLARFDGENWTVYDTSNSELPENQILALSIDAQGNKWIGTVGNGLAKYDGENWTVYDTSSWNPINRVTSFTFDERGNVWIGTHGGGLAKFDGINWTVYNTDNSGLPDNGVHEGLTFDEQGNLWIPTEGGLTQYDGENWNVFNTSNSGLPHNWIWSIAIDSHGNKWIGTDSGGLAVYREEGVIVSVDEMESGVEPSAFSLSQNYPNPFNPRTTINYRLDQPGMVNLVIYDLLGRKVTTLVDEMKTPGSHAVTWDADGLASGVYFYRIEYGGSKVLKQKMMLVK